MRPLAASATQPSWACPPVSTIKVIKQMRKRLISLKKARKVAKMMRKSTQKVRVSRGLVSQLMRLVITRMKQGVRVGDRNLLVRISDQGQICAINFRDAFSARSRCTSRHFRHRVVDKSEQLLRATIGSWKVQKDKITW